MSQSVFSTTRSLLERNGLQALSVEGISTEAGVARTTIYRRWGDVTGIIAELVEQHRSGLVLPQRSTLASDALDFTRQTVTCWGASRNLHSALLALQQNAPNVRTAYCAYLSSEHLILESIADSALDRHELLSKGVGLTALEMLMDTVKWRLCVNRQRLGRGALADLVRIALSGLEHEADRDGAQLAG